MAIFAHALKISAESIARYPLAPRVATRRAAVVPSVRLIKRAYASLASLVPNVTSSIPQPAPHPSALVAVVLSARTMAPAKVANVLVSRALRGPTAASQIQHAVCLAVRLQTSLA